MKNGTAQPIEFHVYLHDGGSTDKLTAISEKLDEILKREGKIQMTLDETLADVQDEKTVVGGLATLTTSIKAQLDAVLGGALTPDQQAKVDAIFTQIEENKKALADAITANTPAAAV